MQVTAHSDEDRSRGNTPTLLVEEQTVQSLFKSVWQCLRKLEINLPEDYHGAYNQKILHPTALETSWVLWGWLYWGLLTMDDSESELSIFCNQARFPVVGLGYQPSYKTWPTTCLDYKMCWGNGGSLLEWQTNDWSNLSHPSPCEGPHNIILWYSILT